MGRKAKQVVQISYYNNRVVKVWDSLTSAGETLGISTSTISLVCKGKLRSAGGYQWRYKESLHNIV